MTALEPVSLGGNPGSALRGALYGSLTEQFCAARGSGVPHWADEKASCPVCWLLALDAVDPSRGKDPPRPITIEPPDGATTDDRRPTTDEWRPGHASSLQFGVTLIGRAIELVPYLVQAVIGFGERGLGRGRGRVRLNGIDEWDPLTRSSRPLLAGGRVLTPKLVIEHDDVLAAAAGLLADRVTLRFLTPTRLTDHGQLVHRPDLGVLVRRLMERLEAFERQASEPSTDSVNGLNELGSANQPTPGGSAGDSEAHRGPNDGPIPSSAFRHPLSEQPSTFNLQPSTSWQALRFALAEMADRAVKVRDGTRWADTWSGSSRTARTTPTGGFVGEAVWRGDLGPLLPWLLWGQSVHVGKDTVKGNGWFEVTSADHP